MADVLFISFTDTELRVTFLQAKSHIKDKPYPLDLANVEQYALLGLRPLITGWLGKVVWSNDILSCAELSSIGSFGVFYNFSKYVGFHYLSADLLLPIKVRNKSQYVRGNFGYIKTCNLRSNGIIDEVVECDNLKIFGAALYSTKIGSPIHFNNIHCKAARTSLARLIINEINDTNDTNILDELISSSHFKDINVNDMNKKVSSGVPGLVVVKGATVDQKYD